MNLPSLSESDLIPTQQEEYRRILHNACSMATYHTTTERTVAKSLLLQDTIFCRGDLRRFVVKHRRLGVYAVSTEEAL